MDRQEITIKVAGMSCRHCEAAIKRNQEALDSVSNVVADNRTETVKIIGSDIDIEEVKNRINSLGYKFMG
jgi:copper chaperone CopZ